MPGHSDPTQFLELASAAPATGLNSANMTKRPATIIPVRDYKQKGDKNPSYRASKVSVFFDGPMPPELLDHYGLSVGVKVPQDEATVTAILAALGINSQQRVIVPLPPCSAYRYQDIALYKNGMPYRVMTAEEALTHFVDLQRADLSLFVVLYEKIDQVDLPTLSASLEIPGQIVLKAILQEGTQKEREDNWREIQSQYSLAELLSLLSPILPTLGFSIEQLIQCQPANKNRKYTPSEIEQLEDGSTKVSFIIEEEVHDIGRTQFQGLASKFFFPNENDIKREVELPCYIDSRPKLHDNGTVVFAKPKLEFAPNTPVVVFAIGYSGNSPFTRYLKRTGNQHQIKHYFDGQPYVNDTHQKEMAALLGDQYHDIYHPAISREANEKYLTDLIDEYTEQLKKLLEKNPNTQFMICGGEKVAHVVIAKLQENLGNNIKIQLNVSSPDRQYSKTVDDAKVLALAKPMLDNEQVNALHENSFSDNPFIQVHPCLTLAKATTVDSLREARLLNTTPLQRPLTVFIPILRARHYVNVWVHYRAENPVPVIYYNNPKGSPLADDSIERKILLELYPGSTIHSLECKTQPDGDDYSCGLQIEMANKAMLSHLGENNNPINSEQFKTKLLTLANQPENSVENLYYKASAILYPNTTTTLPPQLSQNRLNSPFANLYLAASLARDKSSKKHLVNIAQQFEAKYTAATTNEAKQALITQANDFLKLLESQSSLRQCLYLLIPKRLEVKKDDGTLAASRKIIASYYCDALGKLKCSINKKKENNNNTTILSEKINEITTLFDNCIQTNHSFGKEGYFKIIEKLLNDTIISCSPCTTETILQLNKIKSYLENLDSIIAKAEKFKKSYNKSKDFWQKLGKRYNNQAINDTNLDPLTFLEKSYEHARNGGNRTKGFLKDLGLFSKSEPTLADALRPDAASSKSRCGLFSCFKF